MDIKLAKDQEIIQEAITILSEHMEASKVAYIISLLQSGEGDYLKIRDQLFENETLDSLVEKIQAFEANNP